VDRGGPPGAPQVTRDQLEPVHVDEPAVGELQVRDHREGQERQLEERLLERAPHGPDRRAQGPQRVPDLWKGPVGEKPRDGQRQLPDDAPVHDGDEPALEGDQPVHGGGHVRVVGPDDDHVVAVVSHARRERPGAEAEAADERVRRCDSHRGGPGR
jgi:hypothetical protein